VPGYRPEREGICEFAYSSYEEAKEVVAKPGPAGDVDFTKGGGARGDGASALVDITPKPVVSDTSAGFRRAGRADNPGPRLTPKMGTFWT